MAERLERAVGEAVADVRAVRAPSEADRLDDNVAELPGVQRFLVRIVDDEVVLSVDSSGSLLHRRGYRQDDREGAASRDARRRAAPRL